MRKFLKTDNLGNLKVMIIAAVFAAISIVCGKFLAISVGETLRFSFENLPIILSGILFGPCVGAVTGLIADVVGCILRGYAINPILTLAAVLIGFMAGAIYNLSNKFNFHLRLIITVLFCHTLGSVLIKTVGLCVWYGSPFIPTLLTRIVNYIIVAVAESVVLDVLLSKKSFRKNLMR